MLLFIGTITLSKLTIMRTNDGIGEQKWRMPRLTHTLIILVLGVITLNPVVASASSMVYLKSNAGTFVEEIRQNYGEMINIASLLHDADQKLITAVIVVESEGKEDAVSHKGAQGLMQLMPATAASLGVKNAKEPFQNILAGTKYLKELDYRYGFPKVEEALVAYNMGPTRAKRWLSQYSADENLYAKKVMYVYNLLAEEELRLARAGNLANVAIASEAIGPKEAGPIWGKPKALSVNEAPVSIGNSRRTQTTNID